MSANALRPGAVLFACNLNYIRSPMAEALLKKLVGDRVYVDSCGLELPAKAYGREEDFAGGVDPFVEIVMGELNCDLARHRPKTFDDLEDFSFDLVVSLTPEAQHRAVELARRLSAQTEYWPTKDPTLIDGPREAQLAAYRELRDGLAQRIADHFGGPDLAPIDLSQGGAL